MTKEKRKINKTGGIVAAVITVCALLWSFMDRGAAIFAPTRILLAVNLSAVVWCFAVFGIRSFLRALRREWKAAACAGAVLLVMVIWTLFGTVWADAAQSRTWQTLFNMEGPAQAMYGTWSLFASVSLFLALLMMTVFLVSFILVWFFHVKEEYLWLFTGTVCGLVFLMIIPLLTVPDEARHFYTAYHLANEIDGTGNVEWNNSVIMRQDDIYISTTDSVVDGSVDLPLVRYTREQYETYWQKLRTPLRSDNLEPSGNIALPQKGAPRYEYLVTALGLLLGKALRFGRYELLLFGRFCNLVYFILVTFLAIRWMPFAKSLLYVVAMMPMTLQQAASFSYDVFVNSTSFLVIALTLHLSFPADGGQTRPGRVWIAKFALLVLGCVLMVPVKSHAYVAFILLPVFVLYAGKIVPGKVIFAAAGAGASLCVIAAAVYVAGIRREGYDPVAHAAIIEWANQFGYNLRYLVNYPAESLWLVLISMVDYMQTYFRQMAGSQLGWMNILIPGEVADLFLIMAGLAALTKENEAFCTWKGRTFLFLLSVFSVICIIIGFLFSWTYFGMTHVEGVQGRYFLPVFIPLLLSLRGKGIVAGRDIDRIAQTGAAAGLFMAVTYIMFMTPVPEVLP